MAVNIDDILDRLAKLQAATSDARVKEQLPAILKDLKSYAQDQETQRNQMLDALNQQKATIDQLQNSVAALQKINADQAQQIEALKKQITGGESSATPLNLATSFKGVMDAIQAEARQTPGVATTVKSMDLEVKGLVQVSEKVTAMVLPAVGSVIDPNALSTLRISFGAIPVASTPAPPAPAPSPAATVPPSVRQPSGASTSPPTRTKAPSKKSKSKKPGPARRGAKPRK